MTGKQLKAKLCLLGLTQKQLSELLQVSNKTINTVCNAPRVPALYQYAIKGIEADGSN